MTVHITQAGSREVPECAGLLAEAFRDDAAIYRMVPGDHDRTGRLTELYTAVLRTGALASGVLDVARAERGGPILGVASWEGPHRQGQLWRRARQVPRYVRAIGVRYLPAALATLRDYAAVRPRERHWYLGEIAVGPGARGLGVGSALLAHRLTLVDVEALPAYLEATTAGSRRLYERFGFEVIGRIGPGAEAPFAMLRRPGGG